MPTGRRWGRKRRAGRRRREPLSGAEEIAVPILRPDPAAERKQAERLRAHREARNAIACESALGVLKTAAHGDAEMLAPIRAACWRARTPRGDLRGLREVWGTYGAARPFDLTPRPPLIAHKLRNVRGSYSDGEGSGMGSTVPRWVPPPASGGVRGWANELWKA